MFSHVSFLFKRQTLVTETSLQLFNPYKNRAALNLGTDDEIFMQTLCSVQLEPLK